jgi:hypothetical protein
MSSTAARVLTAEVRDATRSPAAQRAHGGRGLRLAAAMFLVGPALIHLAVVPEHLRSYAPYGLFFALLGLGQIALALAVLTRPSAPVLLGGAAASIVVIGIWLASRTVGLPIAAIPWRPEAIGLPDVNSTVMEWVAIVLMVFADRRLMRPKPFRLWRSAPALVLGFLFTLGLTLSGLAAAGASGGH